MVRRRRSTVTVDIDVDEVLESLDDEQLADELRSRKATHHLIGSAAIGSDWLDRMRWYLLRGDTQGALAMVEAELWPARAAAAVASSLPQQARH